MLSVEESKAYVIKNLKATKRPGMNKLLAYMEEIGFFTAPASGGNHLCCEGGLVVHTSNVMMLAEKFGKMLFGQNYKEYRNSLRIAAGLHDLGKCGRAGMPYYAENLVKDGRPTKADPVQKYKRSDSKPYSINKDLCHIDHPLRSVELATRYIDLTEEEEHAIFYHDGMYGSLAYDLKNHEEPLQTCLHFADFWAAQFIEGKELPIKEED